MAHTHTQELDAVTRSESRLLWTGASLREPVGRCKRLRKEQQDVSTR